MWLPLDRANDHLLFVEVCLSVPERMVQLHEHLVSLLLEIGKRERRS